MKQHKLTTCLRQALWASMLSSTVLAVHAQDSAAPASAARVEGGTGTQTSSQISTPSVKSGRSRAEKPLARCQCATVSSRDGRPASRGTP